MRDVIIGAATTISVMGAFLIFGAAMIIAAGKIVEDKKKDAPHG